MINNKNQSSQGIVSIKFNSIEYITATAVPI